MKTRCYNPNGSGYQHWGGRGIKVCAEWQTFKGFVASMGLPAEGMTLDRLDVNGDYTPLNCKWASYREQAINKRTNTAWPGVSRKRKDQYVARIALGNVLSREARQIIIGHSQHPDLLKTLYDIVSLQLQYLPANSLEIWVKEAIKPYLEVIKKMRGEWKKHRHREGALARSRNSKESGVYKRAKGVYVSSISIGGKSVYLGTSNNPELLKKFYTRALEQSKILEPVELKRWIQTDLRPALKAAKIARGERVNSGLVFRNSAGSSEASAVAAGEAMVEG